MFRIVLMIFLLCTSVAVSAQTRRIAHRAHSGANTERYDGRDGNYGDPYIPTHVKVHLESGRDTMVWEYDSIARPYFYDTLPHASIRPVDRNPKADIREIAHGAGRLTIKP